MTCREWSLLWHDRVAVTAAANMSMRTVFLGAAVLLCDTGVDAQASDFPFLPDTAWSYSTACAAENIGPVTGMSVPQCMHRVSEVQWSEQCASATEGVGNIVNQILEGIQRTWVLQKETEGYLIDLVGGLGNGTGSTGIGAAAAVSLPQEFLDNLGDAMSDGELTATEAFCSADEALCSNDVCFDAAGEPTGETCSSAGAALMTSLAEGIAQNMNSAAGFAGDCYLSNPVPDGCIDPTAIMITDLESNGRRRMQDSAPGSHHTAGMDFYHVYCRGVTCSASV